MSQEVKLPTVFVSKWCATCSRCLGTVANDNVTTTNCKNPKHQCKDKSRALEIVSHLDATPRSGAPKSFRMHYIGRGLYANVDFVSEASRIGVQRSVPFNHLAGFKFGEHILLSNWLGVIPTSAEVFGYYTIESLVSTMPAELMTKISERLTLTSSTGQLNVEETRACGKYMVGGSFIISNEMEEVVKKIEDVCKEEHISPRIYKWFLKGKFTAFTSSIILTPAKFSRSFPRVTINGLRITNEAVTTSALTYIYDYQRRRYLKKSEMV